MTIPGMIICSACSGRDYAHNEIIDHIINSHINRANGTFSCEDCKLVLPTRLTALQHFIKSHLSIVYKCGACNFMSNDWKDIILHLCDHTHGRWR